MKNKYRVLGLMSGTSLDGLDLALCDFTLNDTWDFDILEATTIDYPSSWLRALRSASVCSGEDLCALHYKYGRYLGEQARTFLGRRRARVDFIASHGHTIFHDPGNGYTFQLGDINAIAAYTSTPVIGDFRSFDVQRGGQGAPLVPAGDRHLFSEYDVCLNLGGIANLSMENKGKRVAYDICFCNTPLNYVMNKRGKKFDDQGTLASKGEIDTALQRKLSRVYDSFRAKRPSLGREVFEKHFMKILDHANAQDQDILRTVTESIAEEIAQALGPFKRGNVLITGGGAFNSFLIAQLLDRVGDDIKLILPGKEVIKFKEALIFAFLGVLRWRNEINVYSSVTGSTGDSCSGLISAGN